MEKILILGLLFLGGVYLTYSGTRRLLNPAVAIQRERERHIKQLKKFLSPTAFEKAYSVYRYKDDTNIGKFKREGAYHIITGIILVLLVVGLLFPEISLPIQSLLFAL